MPPLLDVTVSFVGQVVGSTRNLIPRSLGGCGHGLCVTSLCVGATEYDRGELDLLPYLEPPRRPQHTHAVGHVGLAVTLSGLVLAPVTVLFLAWRRTGGSCD